MSFQIVQQVEGKEFVPALNGRTKRPLIYDTSRKAAAIAQRLTTVKGVKHQPRAVPENVDWKGRETVRFADGFYKRVAWADQDWWLANRNPDHFTHVADEPDKVAFVRSDKEGALGIYTVMKPGKYLAEFLGGALTPEQIKTFSMWHAMKNEHKDIRWARTPEEIERAYAPRLGSSCFSGSTKANLYGSGDFAVAYIEQNGEITARAVCAPARKVYVRVYGDEARLDKLLQDAGFKRTGYHNPGPWMGLKLLKKHFWPGFYADFGGHFKDDPNDGQYMVIY